MIRHRGDACHRTGDGRGTGDSGVVLILIAVFMIAILTMVAIVIDLGQLRADRRDDQKSADFAALAAGYYMSGKASGSGAAIANPRAACTAALESAKANVPGFPSGGSMNCASLPTNATTCETWVGGPMPMVTLTTTGTALPFVLTIKYPVPDAEISDTTRFGGSGAGVNDGTDQCARMLVALQSQRNTSFAGLVGVSSQTINATSVVKSNLEIEGKNVAALLLLQRTDCGAVYVSGQGKIAVESPSNLNPGRIQVDSDGKGACGSNNNGNVGDFVVYSSSSGNSRVEVQPTSSGLPGIIGLYSLTSGVNGRTGAVVTGAAASNGISTAPVPSPISSRKPVDDKFNPSTRLAITTLHERINTLTASQPSGSTLVTDCNPNGGTVAPVAGQTAVYINCGTYTVANNKSVTIDADQVYFAGRVNVVGSLTIPTATRVYMAGCRAVAAGCGNVTNASQYYALSVTGTLAVNSAVAGPCAVIDTADPVAVPLTHRITEVGAIGGPLVVGAGANLTMCQTFAYLGRTSATYLPLQLTSGLPNCSPDLPCPASGVAGVDEGYVSISGGNGVVNWSAPNRLRSDPTVANPFEDLALWGEGPRQSDLKGTGTSKTQGVFFLPNSYVKFAGQGDQVQPLNAQFISKALELSGQGVLRLKPNPDDAVSSPTPGGYSLIR